MAVIWLTKSPERILPSPMRFSRFPGRLPLRHRPHSLFFLAAILLFLPAMGHPQQTLFTPVAPGDPSRAVADPSIATDPDAVLVRLNEEAADLLVTGRLGQLARLPLPGGEFVDFDLRRNVDAGAPERIEVVTDTGSYLLPVPVVHAFDGQPSPTKNREATDGLLSLTRVNDRFYGMVAIDGVSYEIVRPDKDSTGLYVITRVGARPSGDFLCGVETAPDAFTKGTVCSDPGCGHDHSADGQAAARDSGTTVVETTPDQLARDTALAEELANLPLLARYDQPVDTEVTLAIEAAYEVYTSFGNDENAAAEYLTALMSDVNRIYQRDFRALLRIVNVRIWATSADPYAGAGGSPIDNLNDLSAVMTDGSTPAVIRNANLAHLIGRVGGHGGVAYVGVICAGAQFRTGYSSIDANKVFPNTAYTWDASVIAHELGHNFGTSHTHCYSPPIDECYASEPGCFSGTPVPQVGTIMSYCHLNYRVEQRFHPRVIAQVRAFLASSGCIGALTGDAYEDDDTLANAKPITIHFPQQRSIFPAGDEDWVEIELASPSSIVAETSDAGQAGDTILELYDSGGVLLASDDDSGDGNFSRIEVGCGSGGLAAGTYYLRVTAKNPADTIRDYLLTYAYSPCSGIGPDAYEPDNSRFQASAITDGEVQGRSIEPVGDTDWVSFELAIPSSVEVLVRSGSGFANRNHDASLYDSDLVLLANTRSTRNSNFTFPCSSALPPGLYYIRIGPSNSSQTLSSYELELNIDECCQGVVDVNRLVFNQVDSPKTVNIGIGAACAWTATANQTWVTFPSGAGGTGPGSLEIAVDTYGGLERNALVQISFDDGAAALVEVLQFADCNGNGVRDDLDVIDLAGATASDTCVDAQPVGPGIIYTGTTSGASSDGDTTCGASASSPDVWYSYTPGMDGTLTVSLCGSSYDTVLSIHSGCPGTGANTVVCNDDVCGLQSEASTPVTAFETYLIRVSGFSSSAGTFQMALAGPDSAYGQFDDLNGNLVPDICEGDPNEPPTDILLSNATVEENLGNELVGILTAVDADASQSHSFELLTAGVPFVVSGNELRTSAGGADYEQGATRTVRIRTTDSGLPPLSFEKDFVITIIDVDEPPLLDGINTVVVAEGSTVDITATAVDPEGQPVTFTWDFNGEGTFAQSGNPVTFDATAISGPASIPAAVRASDGGLVTERTFSINVVNVPPLVSAGGPYVVEEGASITLSGATASDPVDSLVLSWDLDNNGVFGEAGGAFGDETLAQPVFDASGLSGPSTYPVAFRAFDGTDAVTASTEVQVVDTTPPTAAFDPVVPAIRTTAVNSATVRFDDAVPDLAVSDFSLSRGATVLPLFSATLSGGPTVYTITNFGAGASLDGSYELRLIATNVEDDAGNAMAEDATVSWIIDREAPTVAAATDDSTQVGGDITGTYTSDPGSGSDIAAEVLWVREPGGTWAVSGPVSGGTFAHTPSQTGDAADGIYAFAVVAEDEAGNRGTEPTGADPGQIAIVYNDMANSTITLDVATGSTVAVMLPMESDLDVILTFTDVTSAGQVTASRALEDTAPAGYRPEAFIDQNWTLSASGGLSFASVDITLEYDPSLLGGLLPSEVTRAYRVDGAVVEEAPVTIDEANNRATVSGATGFSTWYLGSASAGVEGWRTIGQ